MVLESHGLGLPRKKFQSRVADMGGTAIVDLQRIWLRAYLIGREPVMRMSTSLLALCCQSGPDATWETPIRARSRSNGSRSLRMSQLMIARFTNESIPPWI